MNRKVGEQRFCRISCFSKLKKKPFIFSPFPYQFIVDRTMITRKYSLQLRITKKFENKNWFRLSRTLMVWHQCTWVNCLYHMFEGEILDLPTGSVFASHHIIPKLKGPERSRLTLPSMWNKLPMDIKCSPCIAIFKQKLKTHPFKLHIIIIFLNCYIGFYIFIIQLAFIVVIYIFIFSCFTFRYI